MRPSDSTRPNSWPNATTSRACKASWAGCGAVIDYQAFIDNGIPSSGLFTGAEVIKTPEQASIWGGTAGDQFDPCHHQACDTGDNVSLHAWR